MVDSTSRLSREIENRDATKRTQTWKPAETLPTPDPRDGWVFRWIRTAVMGQADPTNASSQFRQGWVAVAAAEHPELQLFSTTQTGRWKDNIEVGGLLLCKAPAELIEQRRKYYAAQAKDQMTAVDNNFMNQKDGRANMELFSDKKTDVSFGKGTK